MPIPRRGSLKSDVSSGNRLLDLLLGCYLLMFVPVFLSNHDRLAGRIFLYLVIPLSVLPFLILRVTPGGLPLLNVELTVRGRIPRRFSLIFLAVCLYLVALNIATWTNGGISTSVLDAQIIRSIHIAIFMLVTTLLMITQPAFIDRLFFSVCLIAALSAAVNVIAFVGALPSWSSLYGERLVAAVGMPSYRNSTNISATYAVLLIGAVGCLMGKRSVLMSAVLAVTSAILLAAILMTQARGALIGTLAGLTAIALTISRRLQLALIAIALPALIALAAVPWVQFRLFRGFSERPEIWRAYLVKASERPLLGYGERQDISLVIPNGSVVDQSHNLILSGQVRGGLLAGAALAFILATGTYWTWRHFRHTGQVAPFAAFVTMAACGMFDYNLLITPVDWPWVTFWLPIALAIGAETSLRNGYGAALATPAPT